MDAAGFEKIGELIIQARAVGIHETVTQLQTLQTQIAKTQNFRLNGPQFTTTNKDLIKTYQTMDYNMNRVMTHGTKTVSVGLSNLQLLARLLKSKNAIMKASESTQARGARNLSSYTVGAGEAANNLMKMKVALHGVGVQITDMGFNLQRLSKNSQWTGKQMMMGLTVPIMGAAYKAVMAWKSVDKEIVRAAKVMSDETVKAMGGQEGILREAEKIGHQYAVNTSIAAGIMGDFAAMGFDTKEALIPITKLAFQMEKLGDVQISESVNVIRTVMKVYQMDVAEATVALEAFNAIENSTAINLKELIPAFPEAASAAKMFGLSATDLASMLAAMYEQGIPATEGAHALKFALASMVKPTRETRDAISKLQKDAPEIGNVFAAISNGSLRGRKAMILLADAFRQITNKKGPAEAEKLLSSMFSKRQVNRLMALFNSINQGEQEMLQKHSSNISDYNSDWARSQVVAGKTATNHQTAMREMSKITNSEAFKMQQAMRDFQQAIADLGKEIMPIAIDIGQKLAGAMQKVLKFFSRHPEVKKMAVALAAVLAAMGPLVYTTAQFGNFAGTSIRAIGKLMPSLGTMSALGKEFMTLGERTRLARQQLVLLGSSSWDTKGGFRKSIETLKDTFRVLTGKVDANVIGALDEATQNGIEMTLKQAEAEIAKTPQIIAMETNTAAIIANTEAIIGSRVSNVLGEIPVKGVPSPFKMGFPGGIPGNAVFPSKITGPDALNMMGFANPKGVEAKFPGKAVAQGIANSIEGEIAEASIKTGEQVVEGVAEGVATSAKPGMFSGITNALKTALSFGGAEGGGIMAGFTSLFTNLSGVITATIIPAITTIAAPIAAIAGPILAIVAAFALLSAGLAVLSGHWDAFWKGVKQGAAPALGFLKNAWNGILEGLNNLWDAVKAIFEPIIDMFDELIQAIFGGGSKKGEKNKGDNAWQTLGKIVGSIAQVVGIIIDGLSQIFNFITKIIKGVAQVIGFLLKWSLKGFILEIKAVIAYIKFAINLAKSLWDILSNLPIIGGLFGDMEVPAWMKEYASIVNKIPKAVDDAQAKLINAKKTHNKDIITNARTELKAEMKKIYDAASPDLRKEISFEKFYNIILNKNKKHATKTAKNVWDQFKRSLNESAKTKKIIAEMPEIFITTEEPIDQAAQDAAQKFADALKSRLNTQMQAFKEMALKAFDDYNNLRLKGFDDQIKAMEAVEKAEQDLYEKQQYLNERRKMLDEFNVSKENYQRNRALAMYEGRYDDARNMDVQFQADTRSHNEQLRNLDEDYNRTMLQKERDAQKERLNAQKEALQEQIQAQRDALQEQLDAIIEYTPRTQEAMTMMVDAMNGILRDYGVPSMGESMGLSTKAWSKAIADSSNDVADEAYWAGLGAAQAAKAGQDMVNPAWVDWFKGLKSDQKRAVLGDPALAGALTPLWQYLESLGPGIGVGVGAGGGATIRMHTGGSVDGPMSPTDVPAVLQSGEFVVQRNAAKKLGLPFLHAINKYHEGGLVTPFDGLMGNSLARQVGRFYLGGGKFGGSTWDDLKKRYAPKTKLNMFDLIGTTINGVLNYVGSATEGDLPVSQFQRWMASLFPEMAEWILSGSTFRENAAFHGTGQALDIGGGFSNPVGTQKIWDFLVPRVEKLDLVELIHNHDIWHPSDGWQYWAPDDHLDHIHVAVRRPLNEIIADNPNFFKPLATGGKIMVDNLPALLHKGETVLPASMVRNLEAATASGGGDTYIMVDNFIGEDRWFEKMLEEYNIKKLPARQRKNGTINRTISSRKDNTRRYIS